MTSPNRRARSDVERASPAHSRAMGKRICDSPLASEKLAKLLSANAGDRKAKPAARRTATYEVTAAASMAAPPATAARLARVPLHRPWHRSPSSRPTDAVTAPRHHATTRRVGASTSRRNAAAGVRHRDLGESLLLFLLMIRRPPRRHNVNRTREMV